MRQTWVTPGGVHPPENKDQSLTQPIGVLPIPEKLVVPLGQHIGAPAIACVKHGDKVLKGKELLIRQALSQWLYMHQPQAQ